MRRYILNCLPVLHLLSLMLLLTLGVDTNSYKVISMTGIDYMKNHWIGTLFLFFMSIVCNLIKDKL